MNKHSITNSAKNEIHISLERVVSMALLKLECLCIRELQKQTEPVQALKSVGLDIQFEEWLGIDFTIKSKDDLFIEFCKRGNLYLAKWLYYDVGGVNSGADNNYAFQLVCDSGRLGVAKWLYYDIGDVDTHANNDRAFKWACEGGHLEIAKWLYYDIGDVDPHSLNDDAFRITSVNGYPKIAEWLKSLD